MASQITCITKPHPHSPLEHITNVGGVRQSGATFYITRERCAFDIQTGADTYFVEVDRRTTWVEIYLLHGTWFIKTKPDETVRDNLLSLPQC